MERFDGPATRLLIDEGAATMLTEIEAKQLQRDIAREARAYARSMERARKLRAQLRKAEADAKGHRARMRLLLSARVTG